MEKIISLTLLAGLCFISPTASQYQFVLVPTPKTRDNAQLACRTNCLDLATIHNMEEMNEVLKLIERENQETVWFGLQGGELGNWHWSLTGNEFKTEGEEFLPWGSETQSLKNCGFFKQGKMHAQDCLELLPFICFDEGEDKRIMVEDTKSWTDAVSYCRTRHTDLASIMNDTEVTIIQDLAEDQAVWVGLFRDSWAWSDKNDSSFRNWASDVSVSGESNTCAAVLKKDSGRWSKVNCKKMQPFICSCLQDPKYFAVKIRLQSSALNFSDPAVQHSILEQMQLKVEETAGIGTVQLRWKKLSNGTVFKTETP